MSAMTSTAETVPAGYYQSFESRTRTMTPPDEQKILQRVDEHYWVQARQQTRNLLLLREGWNGYDAVPPSPAAVNNALQWLDNSYAECEDTHVRWHKPNVGASAEGEVVFWWVAGNRSLNVYIDENEATFHQSLSDGDSTQHTHGDALMGKHQAELMRWFSE